MERSLDSLGEAVFLVDADRRVTYCNSAAVRMFGYGAEEIVGRDTEHLHQSREAYEKFGELGRAMLERRRAFRTDYRMRRKDGTVFPTGNTVTNLHEDLGWQGGVVSVVRDITAQKEIEESLRQRERQYRLLAENTLDVIWSLTLDLEYGYVNPAIADLTGHSPAEMEGTPLRDHLDEPAATRIAELLEPRPGAKAGGRRLLLESRQRRKDGSWVEVEVRARTVLDESGAPVAIQGTTRDISERLRLEEDGPRAGGA